MKHYQKLYYKHFYAQDENGEYISVSKKVCFAPAEAPDATNPYKQRWFYDPEAGYGATKLSGVDPSEYAALLADAEVLGNG